MDSSQEPLRAAFGSPAESESAVVLANSLDSRGQTAGAWHLARQLLKTGNRTTSFVVLFARLAPRFDSAPQALEMVREALANATLDPQTRATLHFCAANLLDSLGQYDEAFDQASLAHELRRTQYDPMRIERLVRDWTTYFSPANLRRLPRATHASRVPVFIVGMPRSGSTLVEQILASHSQVHGAGELDWMFGLWTSAVGRLPTAPASLIECLDQFTEPLVNELSAEYQTRLTALAPAAARIADKLPMNLLNLGLIAILFPQSHVIYTSRDPLDTCLSCFLTDLAARNELPFDLPTTGHLYRHCQQLMSHWRRTLDIPILEVQYEQVVHDLEGQARRMVEFLQLPWDPQCLRYYENPRPVATASSGQVRLPVYTRSVGRWRHYERHLAPLRAALAGPSRAI